MLDSQRSNRLAGETSPYLLQHAHNPVDWYPWGPEALEEARRSDRPILLSIGYSACHWCHVMAHESFEDEATAEVMNRLFVNIKVDREERPDLDRIYQSVHQMLSRRGGGWPLTVCLNPHDLVPFFTGTYFPKEPRYNMPAFVSVLHQLAAFYAEHRGDLARNGQVLREALEAMGREHSGTVRLDVGLLAHAHQALRTNFDAAHGGFGGAPKFPHTSNLEFLLRSDGEGFDMVRKTLDSMACGGIYDHLGGGFARYSVDERWEIPHFEKMLYDNGPLLELYARMAVYTGEPLYAAVATDTAEWVIREMQSPEGGYYAALDADSEGREGRFYVWDRREIQGLLSADEYLVFSGRYGLDGPPNFEGHWHLRIARSLEAVAADCAKTGDEVAGLLESARACLRQAREQRVRPGRDEKIIAAWNGLMIRGMTVAGRLLEREEFKDSADRAFGFVRRAMDVGGRLMSVYKDGRARFDAYLDDYAFLLDAALELLQTRWCTGDLAWAVSLADRLLERFQDTEYGGFFFTATDHEALIQRPKPWMDESMPSGNGIAIRALLRLAGLTGDLRYAEAAERGLQAASGAMARYPHAHGALMNAAREWFVPPPLVILRGEGEALRPWCAKAREIAPEALVYAIPPDAAGLPPALAARGPAPQGPVAYVCRGRVCAAPVDSLATLTEILAAG
ncbi:MULTISPECIES: thioredoxin domain-containing protein [Methylococcus]|uniref:Thioredoxin domain-containing protein n=1 Tax=Methylococcus capsulatus TaxID=414 RepID=A0ABZ2F8Q1_METCP|nr:MULTISPECIES: thioredoxin domain-containing protein [Methylococcus]MDF9391250.1 thioredoxin domain-containing protein [Methylococcus capsulatus]